MSNSKKSPVDAPDTAVPHPTVTTFEYRYDELGRTACIIQSERTTERPAADDQHPETSNPQCQFDASGRVTRIIQSRSG